MARYIDEDVLIAELQEEIDFESTMYTEKQNKYFNMGLKCALRDVKAQPTADVVPRAEVEATIKYYKDTVKSEVAREIFEEIEAALAVHTLSGKSEDYSDGALDTLEWVDAKLAEIKKIHGRGGIE